MKFKKLKLFQASVIMAFHQYDPSNPNVGIVLLALDEKMKKHFMVQSANAILRAAYCAAHKDVIVDETFVTLRGLTDFSGYSVYYRSHNKARPRQRIIVFRLWFYCR